MVCGDMTRLTERGEIRNFVCPAHLSGDYVVYIKLGSTFSTGFPTVSTLISVFF